MKREDVLTILENQELDAAGKLQAIMDINGADVNAKNARIRELEEQAATHATELTTERERYKDYDAIMQERDTLLREKEDRAYSDRFVAVLGKNTPKNDFTRKGMEELFRAEIAKEENKGKEDADIFKAMTEGKEKEWFDNPIRLDMAPTNPDAKVPTSTEAYIHEMYKDNPFYKTNQK